MTATVVSFRWLDILEKEFDKSFVDLDLLLGEIDDIEEDNSTNLIRSKLGALSSCFAQLAHKAQTIFQTNAKLEAEFLNLRHELAELEADRKILKEEIHDMLMQFHANQLKLHNTSSINDFMDNEDTEKIRQKLEKELEAERVKRLSLEIPKEELVLVKRENEMLKKHLLSLQGELSGAKLTTKYLDKELAGRIQQLQLLSRELSGEQHETLWRQLEAEIHLHRHKTIVRTCRSNNLKSPQADSRNCLNGGPLLPKPIKSQQYRIVTLHKPPNLGLGMSITGGREHGIPILISVLHNDLPAGSCQHLFVGDALLAVNGRSLKDVSHSEAVQILSSVEGDITFEVMFVAPDDEEDISVSLDDPLAFRYRMFDEEVASAVSSLQLLQNGRLSRASIDSIRGSTDNILESSSRSSLNEVNATPGSGEQLPSQEDLRREDLFPPLGEGVLEGSPDESPESHLQGKLSDSDAQELLQRATDIPLAPSGPLAESISGDEKESDDDYQKTPFIGSSLNEVNATPGSGEQLPSQEDLRREDLFPPLGEGVLEGSPDESPESHLQGKLSDSDAQELLQRATDIPLAPSGPLAESISGDEKESDDDYQKTPFIGTETSAPLLSEPPLTSQDVFNSNY